jgi:hypothetical protein
MEVESIKSKIIEIHKTWKTLRDNIDCYKYGSIHESCVIQIIAEYCIVQGYEVEGFPIQKRIYEILNANYDETYFCHDRYVKYLDVLATQHDDVFELMYFYSSTFWPKQFYNEKRYKETLLDYIRDDIYEVDF